jgi:hypothetical protein
MDGWKEIQYVDIPSRIEFERHTIAMMRQGITNSDRMRDKIRQDRKLIIQKPKGHWNESPSEKFVNEHAWVLKDLVERYVIETLSDKEYRLSMGPQRDGD